jgi:putative NADH-flavin reductase
MRLFILGATGHTGRELTDLALKRHHQVTAFVRSPEKLAIVDQGLTVIQGSPNDEKEMARVMKGHDAVFSALGPKPKEIFTALRNRSWTMEDFAAKTLSSMEKAGVQKLVLFSSAGVFPGGTLLVKFLSFLARNHMEDLRRMENAVIESQATWTIARPAWLGTGTDENYRAEVAALPAGALKMSFRALAKFMLDTAESGLYPRQIVGLCG